MDDGFLRWLQFVLGAGFVLANVTLGWKLVRAWRHRRTAIVSWAATKPPYYGLMLGMAVVFGALVLINVFVLRRPPRYWFWELMMFAYYGYLVPLSTRIQPGLYGPGVWVDRAGAGRAAGPAFVNWGDIGALAWREEADVALLLVLRKRNAVRRLVVPRRYYGEVRRLLRDRIRSGEIALVRPPLDLLGHDEREGV